MSDSHEQLKVEYGERVARGEFGSWCEIPTRPHGIPNPDDPDGPPLEGPSQDDLRGMQIVRVEDSELPQHGIEVGTPTVIYHFMPKLPPKKEARKVDFTI